MKDSPRMPVLFLGHGSPMNAIEENEFVQGFRKAALETKSPRAILCISAHWETRGIRVTAMANPRTIHDFRGFPEALFKVQYPAPGDPSMAREIKGMIRSAAVQLDDQWGLDHGAWSVIKHMYPEANIPVIQLSLDYTKDARSHYEMAKELGKLREKGVLILGSGNMVHNLQMVDWGKLNEPYGYDWAEEANQKMIRFMLDRNHDPLIAHHEQGRAFELAIPTSEHYLPLLYALALQDKQDSMGIFNDRLVAGSISMTAVRIGS